MQNKNNLVLLWINETCYNVNRKPYHRVKGLVCTVWPKSHWCPIGPICRLQFCLSQLHVHTNSQLAQLMTCEVVVLGLAQFGLPWSSFAVLSFLSELRCTVYSLYGSWALHQASLRPSSKPPATHVRQAKGCSYVELVLDKPSQEGSYASLFLDWNPATWAICEFCVVHLRRRRCIAWSISPVTVELLLDLSQLGDPKIHDKWTAVIIHSLSQVVVFSHFFIICPVPTDNLRHGRRWRRMELEEKSYPYDLAKLRIPRNIFTFSPVFLAWGRHWGAVGQTWRFVCPGPYWCDTARDAQNQKASRFLFSLNGATWLQWLSNELIGILALLAQNTSRPVLGQILEVMMMFLQSSFAIIEVEFILLMNLFYIFAQRWHGLIQPQLQIVTWDFSWAVVSR